MSTEVTLPALGESVTEGTISRWLKQVGETVEADEPLLEVSTDKVDTEVPSPVSGTVLEIRFQEDDVADVGAVLAVIGDPSNTPAPATQPTPPAPVPPATPAPAAPAPAPVAPPAPAASPATPAASNTTEVTLPALGESVTEGTISRWLKQVGETVEADEPLLEVSTDKVDTEVPSPVSGTVLEIRFQEDDVADVGAVLAVIGDPSNTPAPATQPTPPAPVPPATPAPAAPAPAPVAPPAPAASPATPAAPPAAGPNPVVAPRASGDASDIYVTPLVRKMAADLGVNLSTVKGTGVGGRIRKQDVQAAAAAAKAPVEAPVAPAAPAPVAAAAKSTVSAPAEQLAKRGTTEKLPRMRQVIAQRMNESLQISAQLTATTEVDMTAISNLRNKVKTAFKQREGVGLTYLAFITKAVIETLQKFPTVNASMNLEDKTLTYHGAEHIGIAVNTDRGLLVPVIKDAGDLNVAGLAKAIGDLGSRTRANKVSPEELAGSTFTITNYGGNGTLFDTPIINQPNVAILGTGALVKRPVVVTDEFGNDTIAIRGMMYLSLTYDHRLIDGASAGDFLSALKARLEGGDFGAEFGI